MLFVFPNFESISYAELPHFSRFRYQGFYWSVYDRISLLATEEPSKVWLSIQTVGVLSNKLWFKCNEVDCFAKFVSKYK